jgi:RHS repeat-associated protein
MLARARYSVRRHLIRAWLTAVGTLLWSLAASQSAMGQAPPAITISTPGNPTAGDTVYATGANPLQIISFCVPSNRSVDSIKITLNGTNVTSQFGTDPGAGASCSGTEVVDTAHVTWLSWGMNTLTAYACSRDQTITDPQYCGSGSAPIKLTYVEVTPKGTATSGHVNESASQVFEVTNLISESATINVSVTCSGSGVSGCTASPTRLSNMTGYSSQPVTVTFTAGALNSTGTITLVAYDSAQTPSVDTGSVSFTAQWLTPETISTAYTNQEDHDLSRCADNCFALRTAMSTVPYISLDAANAVTLSYNSDQMANRPVLYADVKVASSSPYTLEGFQLSAQYYDRPSASWLHITFLNGDQTLNFAGFTDTATHRLAGQFSDSAWGTNNGQGVYRLMMQVVTRYSDHSDTLIDSTHHILVVNGNSSPIAKGWSIAGIDIDNWAVGGTLDQSYVMTLSGEGSTFLFGPVQCFSWGCNWFGGNGVFAYHHYTSTPSQGSEIFPDSTRRFTNSSGYTSSIVVRPYDTVAIGYDGQNRVISISDPYRMQPSPNNTLHTYWVINYGANGISSIVEPDSAGHPGMGRPTTITVNSSGLLTAWQDPDGVSTRFKYDSHNRLDTLYDRKGNATAFAYDSISWKLVRITSPSVPLDNHGTGVDTAQTIVEALTPWQTIGVPTTTTSGTPATPVLVSNVIAADSTSAGKTTFTADRWGQPLAVTDPLGLVTTFAYDANGFDSVTTYPSGAVDRFVHNGPFLSSSTPAGQNQTQYGYCAYGQLCQVNVTGGPSQTMFVNANGHTDSVTVARSTWRFYGDPFGRDTLAVDAQHDTTKYRYETHTGNLDSAIAWPSYRFTASMFDGHGRTRTATVSTPTGPLVVTTTAYDSVNRVVSSTDGLHTTPTRFTYDSLYNTVITDPKGQAYHYAYNALGWDTTETDTTSRTLRATYNNLGLPTTNRNRRDSLVKTTYDSYGRVTVVTRPSSELDNADHFRYPDVYTVVDSNSVVKDVAYSDHTTGLIDSITTTFIPTSNWFKRSYTHDGLGRVTKVAITSSDSSTFKFNSRATGYDATTGLIDSLDITSSSNRLTFGYDSLFRLTSTTYPGGITRTDTYFTSGQLAGTGWGTILGRNYGYDSTGHVNEIDYGYTRDSTTSTLYQYDVLGELTQAQLIKWTDTATSCPGGQLQNGFGCRYGSSRSDTVLQTVTYSYDTASSLRSVQVGSADTVATIAPGNRLTAWTGLTFTVDSDGNRTSTTAGSTTTTYTWGADGRLLKVTQGSNTRSYDYDPSGQLVQRMTNGTVDRYYLWDNGQILAILDGTASHRIAEFVYFGGADQPLARITGATSTDTIHYYAQDASGNVIAQFQGASLEQSIVYDPWGAATVQHFGSDTTTPPLRWKGLLYEDGITSLYYVRARWFDPVTRRFVSADPLDIAAGVNQYAYAGGDPIEGSDPSGLCRSGEIQYDGAIDAAGVPYHSCGAGDGTFLYYEADNNPGVPFMPAFPRPTQYITAPANVTAWAPMVMYYGPFPAVSAVPLGAIGGGSGGAAAGSAPWYTNSCITGALGNGLLHVGVDAIGLLPEGGLVSHAVGRAIGYRGIVATQQGNKLVKGLGLAIGMISTSGGLNETTSVGLASTGLGLAAVGATFLEGAPGVGQAIAGIAVGVDIYATVKAIASCN